MGFSLISSIELSLTQYHDLPSELQKCNLSYLINIMSNLFFLKSMYSDKSGMWTIEKTPCPSIFHIPKENWTSVLPLGLGTFVPQIFPYSKAKLNQCPPTATNFFLFFWIYCICETICSLICDSRGVSDKIEVVDFLKF